MTNEKPTTIRGVLSRLISDCLTSANGDYDPARVIGYGFVVLAGPVFLGLSIYDTIVNKKFDSVNYAVGVGGISTAIAAAAAGVFMKKSTEIPLDTTSTMTTATPSGDTTTTLDSSTASPVK